MRVLPGLLRWLGWLCRSALVLLAAVGLTFAIFLVLPLLQEMGRAPEPSLEVRTVDATVMEAPPPPPPEEEKPEEEVDEPPPTELTEQSQPLDLTQLEMALDPGFGDGVGGAGALAGGRLGGGGSDADRDKDADAVFAMADLDQAPRVMNQPPPRYPPELRSKKVRGTVYILFVVDRLGRVVKPLVQKSTHSAFDRPALEAVRQWRFEPGKRNGQAVQFRMRVPITFACG
jgi:periplasmic protein TonB